MNVLEVKEIIQRMYKGEPTITQLDALKIAYAALDKQLPMEPDVRQSEVSGKYYLCPECGRVVGLKVPYCRMCGQKIDWS